jgi:hypothetical protein
MRDGDENVNRIWDEPEGKRLLGRARCRWEGSRNWTRIYGLVSAFKVRVFLSTAMKHWVPWKQETSAPDG